MLGEIQIKIPLELYKAAEAVVLQTEDYKTPTEVVCYVLREFVPNYQQHVYSSKEQEELKSRLKALGYLG